MKKIIAFLLLANIIWLNSCSLVLKSANTVVSEVLEHANENDSKLTRSELMNYEYEWEQTAKQLMPKLITAINEEDREAIKSMFAANALEKAGDIDEDIDHLFKYVHGKIDMPKIEDINGFTGSTSLKYGSVTKNGYRYYVNVKTDLDWEYVISFWIVNSYNDDSHNVGVHRISVNIKDYHVEYGSSSGYPWSDYYSAGLYISKNDILTGNLLPEFKYVYQTDHLYKYYLDELFAEAGLTEEEKKASIVHQFDADLNEDGYDEKLVVLRSAVHTTEAGQTFQILKYDESSNTYIAIAEQPLLLEDLVTMLRIGEIYITGEKTGEYMNVYYRCGDMSGVFKYDEALGRYVFTE